jgi:hypothetical protein
VLRLTALGEALEPGLDLGEMWSNGAKARHEGLGPVFGKVEIVTGHALRFKRCSARICLLMVCGVLLDWGAGCSSFMHK